MKFLFKRIELLDIEVVVRIILFVKIIFPIQSITDLSDPKKESISHIISYEYLKKKLDHILDSLLL